MLKVYIETDNDRKMSKMVAKSLGSIGNLFIEPHQCDQHFRSAMEGHLRVGHLLNYMTIPSYRIYDPVGRLPK